MTPNGDPYCVFFVLHPRTQERFRSHNYQAQTNRIDPIAQRARDEEIHKGYNMSVHVFFDFIKQVEEM